jgi:hypothetical protein
MEPKEILDATRRLILEHAGDDPDRRWYANRFVFARLQLDERKTKSAIKQKLLNAGTPCHGCGKTFESQRNVHLHRLDGDKAYSEANCVLMHGQCHEQHHAAGEAADGTSGGEPTATKWSKRYEHKPFIYWWDIAPPLAAGLDSLEAVEFGKKDTRERCVVPAEVLKPFLSSDRQTSRGAGNWGIRVLKERPDELAFEPGAGSREWRFLPVVWLEEAED